jgi:transposase InsO family protein
MESVAKEKPLMPTSMPIAKRGWPVQRPRREAERTVRRHAVAFDRWSSRRGVPHVQVAAQIGVARSTLAGWGRRWRADRLDARPLGRPLLGADRRVRNAVVEFMVHNGAMTGLPTLETNFPDVTRRQLQNLQVRYRRVWRIRNRRHVAVLHWQEPGTVWAMDHADPPAPLDGIYPHLLAIRDLASGYQLAWLPVPSKAAAPVLDALRALVLQFGPPLVLKCDNGSPFIAEDLQVWLAQTDIFPLFSPVRTPQYNGGCEAGNGSLERRTEELAARAGRPALWTCDDAEGARRMANEVNCMVPRPLNSGGRTPRSRRSGERPSPPRWNSSAAVRGANLNVPKPVPWPPWTTGPLTEWRSAVLSSSTAYLPSPGGNLLHRFSPRKCRILREGHTFVAVTAAVPLVYGNIKFVALFETGTPAGLQLAAAFQVPVTGVPVKPPGPM